jgi:pimeloyl-ACP methyl ester carboxylesterase
MAMRSSSAGQRMRPVTFLTEDGLQLRGSYWEGRTEGGISLLLIHDKGADRSVWDSYVNFFLSRGWSVLTFDLRGHGESLRQEARANLLPPGTSDLALDAGWALDVQAALAFLARQPKATPGRRAAIGLGLGADLAYAAAALGWGTSSTVCVSPNDERARALAGPGTFQPRSIYFMYGALDPVGADAVLGFATAATYPSECMAYEGTSITGIHLWDERQPEIVARSIAWIERTI